MADRLHERSPWRIAYEGLLQATVSRSNGPAGPRGYSESLERDSKGIVKPAVSLAVCDEFPTVASVQAETTRRMNELCRLYPLPNGDAWTGEGAMLREPFNNEPVPAEDIPF